MPQLKTMLVTLLKTSTPVTIGATLQAVDSICPDHLDLLHPYYRKICMLLIDSDEWGQVVVLAVLQRYVRNYLEKPEEQEVQKAVVNKQYDDQTPGSAHNDNDQSGAMSEALPESSSAPPELDPDLELLLHCTLPLFQSRNPAVTLAAIRLFYLCASSQVSSEDLSQHKIIPPLLRLCSVTQDTNEVAWSAWEVVREIAEQRPASLFDCCSSLPILGPIDADRAVWLCNSGYFPKGLKNSSFVALILFAQRGTRLRS